MKKSITLKSGYSQKTLSGNIALLMHEGKPQSQAIAIAEQIARTARARRKITKPPRKVSAASRAKCAKVSANPAKRTVKFPVTAKATKELHAALKLYRNFSGHEPEIAGKTKKPVIPDTGIVIGNLDGIAYETVRDGIKEKYFHKFDKKSRPLLCSSFDGKMIFVLHGKYNFTEDGIVDRK